MLRDAYLLVDHRALFFYSFKAGCTSLKDWIFERVKPRRLDGLEHVLKRRYINSPNINVSRKTASTLILEHGFRGSIITRNPYDRAISGYLNKFVRDGERWLENTSDCEDFAQKMLFGRLEYSFIDHLSDIKESMLCGRHASINRHFTPQVTKDDASLLEELFKIRLERIDIEMSMFCDSVGMDFGEFPRSRATVKPEGFCPIGDLSHVDRSELTRKKMLPGRANLLTRETVGLIDEIYSLDFELLEYKRESASIA